MAEESTVRLVFKCNSTQYSGTDRPHTVEVVGNFLYKSKRQKFINELKPLIKKYQW